MQTGNLYAFSSFTSSLKDNDIKLFILAITGFASFFSVYVYDILT